MDVQVIGHRGMLGSAVQLALTVSGHHVVTLNPSHLIQNYSPDDIQAPVVVNCAGIVPQRSELISSMIEANAVGPHNLEEACNCVGARLIHVSTDCVFSDRGPHYEDAIPSPTTIYGRSKLLGEVTTPPHLTLRTSFIGYGERGLLWELISKPYVVASNNLLWSGHTVYHVARTLVSLVERSDITGLLHQPGMFQSRLDLVNRLINRFNLETKVVRDDKFVADRRLISHHWIAYDLPISMDFDRELREQM